jgi:hypothetical protein
MCGERGCDSSQDRCCGTTDDGCGDGCGCNCGCGGHGSHSAKRRYRTKAEQIAELEAYLSELKTEVLAVEERLADLRG